MKTFVWSECRGFAGSLMVYNWLRVVLHHWIHWQTQRHPPQDPSASHPGPSRWCSQQPFGPPMVQSRAHRYICLVHDSSWQLVFTEKTFQFLSFHLGILLGILWSSGINSRMNLPWKWNTKTHAVAWGGSCWQAHLWVLYIQWWVHLWHLRNEFPKSPRLPPRRESSEHLAGWYTRKKGGDQGAAPDKANQFMLFNDQSLSAVTLPYGHACNSNCFTSVTSENKKTRADPHLSAACRRHPVLRLHPKGNQQSAKWSSHWGPCPAPKKARDHHVSRSMQRHDGQGDASSPPVGNTQTVLSFMQWCPYIRSNWAETCTLFSCLMAASM